MIAKTILVAAVLVTLGAVPVVMGPSAKLGWDPVEMDIQGNAENVVNAEISISEIDQDMNIGGTALKTVNGISPAGTGVALSALQVSLPQRQYNLWVRVQDEAGNWSSWGGPLLATYDSIPPATPGGCRLIK